MPREIHYLTVQDHLWINLQVTKANNKWNFAQLEEAVYYQYGYGNSTDLISQAARYIVGFPKKAPFTAGNDATAFVGLITFLKLNDYEWKLDDERGLAFFDEICANPDSAIEKVRQWTRWHPDDEHHVDVAETGKQVLADFPKTIAALSQRDRVALG